MNANEIISDNDYDIDADATIAKCLAAEPPISFFLFAGAGSGKTSSLKKALEELEKVKGERLCLDGKHDFCLHRKTNQHFSQYIH